jgi:hypothetical protein
MMREEGYPRFSMHWHTELWHQQDAKGAGKGYGVDVAGSWFWYPSWVELVRRHCEQHADIYA